MNQWLVVRMKVDCSSLLEDLEEAVVVLLRHIKGFGDGRELSGPGLSLVGYISVTVGLYLSISGIESDLPLTNFVAQPEMAHDEMFPGFLAVAISGERAYHHPVGCSENLG